MRRGLAIICRIAAKRRRTSVAIITTIAPCPRRDAGALRSGRNGVGHHLPDRGQAAMVLSQIASAHVATAGPFRGVAIRGPSPSGSRPGESRPRPRAHVATPGRFIAWAAVGGITCRIAAWRLPVPS
jgi:hypothetical protein